VKRHELKCQPADFRAVLAGTKTHEARLNDRHYQVGDLLVLREWVPTADHPLVSPSCKGTGQQVIYGADSRKLCQHPHCFEEWPATRRPPGHVTPADAPPDLAPPHEIVAGRFTGRQVTVRVTHLTCGQYGLPQDLAIMSIKLEDANGNN
jgi:hypothetical protein